MASSNLPSENKLEDQVQKRISELEKTNQALQAEILECKKNEEILAFKAQLLSKTREAVFSTDTNYVLITGMKQLRNYLAGQKKKL